MTTADEDLKRLERDVRADPTPEGWERLARAFERAGKESEAPLGAQLVYLRGAGNGQFVSLVLGPDGKFVANASPGSWFAGASPEEAVANLFRAWHRRETLAQVVERGWVDVGGSRHLRWRVERVRVNEGQGELGTLGYAEPEGSETLVEIVQRGWGGGTYRLHDSVSGEVREVMIPGIPLTPRVRLATREVNLNEPRAWEPENVSQLPGWDPRHVCGLFCDGQNGNWSRCSNERRDGPPVGTRVAVAPRRDERALIQWPSWTGTVSANRDANVPEGIEGAVAVVPDAGTDLSTWRPSSIGGRTLEQYRDVTPRGFGVPREFLRALAPVGRRP